MGASFFLLLAVDAAHFSCQKGTLLSRSFCPNTQKRPVRTSAPISATIRARPKADAAIMTKGFPFAATTSALSNQSDRGLVMDSIRNGNSASSVPFLRGSEEQAIKHRKRLEEMFGT